MPLKKLDSNWYQGECLNFHDLGPVSAGSSTHLFSVMDRKSGNKLGIVKWWIYWRQYCFFPLNAVFDKKLLREVAEFLEEVTTDQRAKNKR